MPIFLKLKTHFWIVQEYSQLSRADYFNDDMQELCQKKTNKPQKPKVFMPLTVEVSLKVRYMYI